MNAIVVHQFTVELAKLYDQLEQPTLVFTQHLFESDRLGITMTRFGENLHYVYGELGNLTLSTPLDKVGTLSALQQKYDQVSIERQGTSFQMFDQQHQSLVSGQLFNTRTDQVKTLNRFSVEGRQLEAHNFWPNGQEISQLDFASNNWVQRKIYFDGQQQPLVIETYDFNRHEGEHPTKITVLSGEFAGDYPSNEALMMAYIDAKFSPTKLFPIDLAIDDSRVAEPADIEQRLHQYDAQYAPDVSTIGVQTDYNPDEVREVWQEIDQETNTDKRTVIFQRIFGETGTNVKFLGRLRFDCAQNIYLGEDFWANDNIMFNATAPIRLGNRVVIGPNVSFYAGNHPLDTQARQMPGTVYARPITIGDNVWIGGSVTILGGTIVGDNSVIGAGSVVRGHIPANSLVLGNPAQVVKKLNPYLSEE